MKKILTALAVLSLLSIMGIADATGEGGATFKEICQSCHGPDGRRSVGPGVEPIAGKSSADIMKMLNGYKDGSFGGQRRRIMQGVVNRLSAEQLRNAAEFVSGL